MNSWRSRGYFRRGFSLIELSIVLMISSLMLIISIGVSSMVETARINGLLSDVAFYRYATKDFKEMYGFWPGDLLHTKMGGKLGNNINAFYSNNGFSENFMINDIKEEANFFRHIAMTYGNISIIAMNGTGVDLSGATPTYNETTFPRGRKLDSNDLYTVKSVGPNHPLSAFNENTKYYRKFGGAYGNIVLSIYDEDNGTIKSLKVDTIKKIEKKFDDRNPLNGSIILYEATNTDDVSCYDSNSVYHYYSGSGRCAIAILLDTNI